MSRYVLALDAIDGADGAVVGGKGAQLGQLSCLDGIVVPNGFVVTTAAFERLVQDDATVGELLDRLSHAGTGDGQLQRRLAVELRDAVESWSVPDAIASDVVDGLARLGDHTACAVRSSATAEDLPAASFAGQHDTLLNVVGSAAVLDAVKRCWASLFTERAVAYRVRNAIDHRAVRMAVVVQQMVAAEVSGVMFTADPVTSNRRTVSVEAAFGLGEALVSGRVSADVFKVRDDEVIATTIAAKLLSVEALPEGGIVERPLSAHDQTRPTLTNEQVVVLARLGRRIEAHFGCPQDIEWCLVDGGVQIVQSRPITTLFPVPSVDDDTNRVYVSVGHQQMMTDAMRPLGLSVWQMTTPAPMVDAGGRLFVDVTPMLASPARRAGLLEVFARSDPWFRDAFETLIARVGFLPPAPSDEPTSPPVGGVPAVEPIDTDPAIVAELMDLNRASVAELRRQIATKSGVELFEFIATDIAELRRVLFDPRSHQAVMAGMEATWWLNDHLEQWLGETNAADTLSLSVKNNVTSEMGLALLDVADVVRPHCDVVAFLESGVDDDFLDELVRVDGGVQVHDAIVGYLERYGMRCVGEIDITRPRWSEQPSALVPVILGHVRSSDPGAAARRFETGRQLARAKEHDVLGRLRELPDGDGKAEETTKMIDRLRTFTGYREYPKYGMISRYFVYKQALLAEADRLVDAGVLGDRDDVFWLRFDELRNVVRAGFVDLQLISDRKAAFASYQTLTPPRILTSDGEAVSGIYRRDNLPAGALGGLGVSSGIVVGRARVVVDIADADLSADDILVTAYTDPSWSPLFVAIAGLVTEVGGTMTHGAVVAREYGLPAVVGVDEATKLISDGQRIRIDGTHGYVELLDAAAPDETADTTSPDRGHRS